MDDLEVSFLARRYRDENEAKRMFDWLFSANQTVAGGRRLGVYRCKRGGDGPADVIAIVSFDRPGIEWAEQVMDGEPYEGFNEEEIGMMVARRMAAIITLTGVGAKPGTYRVVGDDEKL